MSSTKRVFYKFRFFFGFFALCLTIWWAFLAFPSKAIVPKNPADELENYDIRTDTEAFEILAKFRAEGGKTAELIETEKQKFLRGEENLRRRVPTLIVEYNEDLKIPEVIAPDVKRGKAFLTEADKGNRPQILRQFLSKNTELIGLTEAQIGKLEIAADYTNPDGNLSFVHLMQKFNGIEVFRGEIKAGFTRNNEIVRIINNFAPAVDEDNLPKNFGEAVLAIRNAFPHVKRQIKPTDTELNAEKSNDLRKVFGTGETATIAEKIYFPTEIGVMRSAWRILIWEAATAYYVIVDAETGTLLWRKNLVNHQTQAATYNIYFEPSNLIKAANNPAPFYPGPTNPNSGLQPPVIPRQNVNLIGNEPPYNFNNLGWIADGQNTTDGNNAEAGIDRDGTDGVDPEGKATGNPNRNFIFNYAPGGPNGTGETPFPANQTYPPTQFQQGAVTQLFYLSNRWHDEMYLLGFTEAARNFQTDNFGRGGLGNDRLRAEVQDGSGFNNANMATLVDGERSRMQMYVWDRMTPNRDGTLDAEIVVHELTHGLSNRLHGNAQGLGGTMATGMGEGWSDFYAIAMLAKQDDPINGVYPVGGYVTYNIFLNFTANYYYGARRFPRAVRSFRGANNRPHDPLTFADLDPQQINLGDGAFISSPRAIPTSTYQVHNAGEIWSGALWEIRCLMVSRLGFAEGTRRTLQFVTDGMKLAPLNPTFLQERDAIIAASQASGTSADTADIWNGFAIRGMGFSSKIVATSPPHVDEAFDLPNLLQTPAFTFSDVQGNNNGFAEPGEKLILSVPLTNPLNVNSENVTLQIGADGVAVSYGTISAGATVSRQINFIVPSNAACGSVLNFPFRVNSSFGTVDLTSGDLIVGSPTVTFAQNFDASTSLPPGWTTSTTGFGFAWAVDGTTPNSAPNAAYTFDVSVAGSSSLVSPAIQVVSPAAMLKFRQNFRTQTNRDGGVLEISINGGNFRDIWTAGGKFISGEYNGSLTGTENPLFDRRGWTGNSNGYITTEVRLPASAAGKTVRLRWRMGHDTSGGLDRWQIDDIQLFDSLTCASVPISKARSDFDGDGKSDISVFRNRTWFAQRSSAGFTAQNWGVNSDTLTPGDFDGDRQTDLAVWRTGVFYVLNSSNGTFSAVNWGATGDLPVNGDFNGDGRDDFAVFRPANGVWYVLPSNGDAFLIEQFGLNGDLPVSGDFDGDGSADLAVFRNGVWFLRGTTAGFSSVNWGISGDRVVSADFDNDNKSDIAVFRNGVWFILRSSDLQAQIVSFGLISDVPVPADYDGDGADDIAVFRGGIWYILRSTAGLQVSQFGLTGDTPIPARYLP